jgi:hypothetical protein
MNAPPLSTFPLFPKFQRKAREAWNQTVLGRDSPLALSVRSRLVGVCSDPVGSFDKEPGDRQAAGNPRT